MHMHTDILDVLSSWACEDGTAYAPWGGWLGRSLIRQFPPFLLSRPLLPPFTPFSLFIVIEQ